MVYLFLSPLTPSMSEPIKKKWYKKRRNQIIIAIAGIVIIGLIANGAKPDIPEFSSTTVDKIDLIQSVSETGAVQADLKVDYGWEVSGRVIEINATLGQTVQKGDIIAKINNGKQAARLQEAQSAYAAAVARLNLEIAGAADEDIRKSQAAVDQAKAAVNQYTAQLEKTKATANQNIINAEKNLADAEVDLRLSAGGNQSQVVQDSYDDLVNILKTAITVLSDALTEADNILGIDNTFANDAYDDILSDEVPINLSNARSSYKRAKDSKSLAELEVIFLSSNDQELVNNTAQKVQEAVSNVQQNLFYVQLALDTTFPREGFLTQAELDTLKGNINTARTSVDSQGTKVTNGIQAITTAKNSLTTAQIAYDKADVAYNTTKQQEAANVSIAEAQLAAQQANLNQAQASFDALIVDPRDVDLASLRADVSRQGANVAALRDDFNKTQLIALADGVISTLDVEVGETVTANQQVLSIISPQLSVDVDISESDIAKIENGDAVDITLDAFGDDVHFSAKVVSIEPAETEISGVIYYKTKMLFDEPTEENKNYDIRAGMTANIDIHTDRKDQVLVIPQRAVLNKDQKTIVRRVTNEEKGQFEEVEVTVGLKGNDGQIEIVSGLNQDDIIITFINEDN